VRPANPITIKPTKSDVAIAGYLSHKIASAGRFARALFSAMNFPLGVFSGVLRVCIAMHGCARCFGGILPLPLIQSAARDIVICLVGFLTIAHFHIRVPCSLDQQ
jgi:hypothetical protein